MFDTKYGIRINPDNIDLVTFLNDGVRPEIKEDHSTFLIVKVDGPREITTNVMTLAEYDAQIKSTDILHEVF